MGVVETSIDNTIKRHISSESRAGECTEHSRCNKSLFHLRILQKEI